ncbi:MAG TPA: TPM domain-containing protein [Vicinamibacterales bacterium]|nr:TPM domain-containing protein [Vicinamibacterales bacterium]
MAGVGARGRHGIGNSRPGKGTVGALLIVAILTAAGTAMAQEPPPELTRPVTDLAGVVDAASEQAMDRAIRALQAASGDVVVVATVPTFQPYGDIREYAVRLFENRGRGIGQKGQDNGLLILLAVEDRRVWIEVGYGLEGFVTDRFAGETSRQYMAPAFRAGNYGAGLRAGVERIVGRIADGRGVSLDGVEPVPAAPRAGRGIGRGAIIGLIVLFVILRMISGGGGRRGGFRGRRGAYWGAPGWSGWNSGVGSFGGGRGGFGGGFGGFGGGRSGGGGGGAGW